MNDNNKSSQDVEFDFNNPKATEKIVDPSMIRSGAPANLTMIKISVVGFLGLISLGYFFLGSAPKKIEPKALPPVLQNLKQEQHISLLAHPREADRNTNLPLKNLPADPIPVPDVHAQDTYETHDAHESNSSTEHQEPKPEVTISQPSQKILEEQVLQKKSQTQITDPTKEPVSIRGPNSQKENIQNPSALPSQDSVDTTIIAPSSTVPTPERSVPKNDDYIVLSQKIEDSNYDLKILIGTQSEKFDAAHNTLQEGFKKYAAATMLRLDQLAKDQATIAHSLQILSQKIQENDDQLKRIDKFVQAEMIPFAESAAGLSLDPSTPKYVVHAIIPGRAWLRDPQNKIISITEGQEIDGYGKVLTIDPKLGTVILSSGQVLRY